MAPRPDPEAPARETATAKGAGRRDLGLLLTRLGFGFLFAYGHNPLARGGPYREEMFGEALATPWAFPEVWVRMAVELELGAVYDGVSIAMLVLSVLIVFGTFFRTACVAMALVFVALWAFVFNVGSALAIQVGYLAFALAFVGLGLIGPGRYGLNRATAL